MAGVYSLTLRQSPAPANFTARLIPGPAWGLGRGITFNIPIFPSGVFAAVGVAVRAGVLVKVRLKLGVEKAVEDADGFAVCDAEGVAVREADVEWVGVAEAEAGGLGVFVGVALKKKGVADGVGKGWLTNISYHMA
jgi:hypothetical protein